MSEPRRVFLTGATGFIGGRLARRLAARGDRLVCLARPSSDTEELEWLGAEIVRGDLTDAGLLEEAMRGADIAYHLAAVYDIGVVDAAAMMRANVGGTRAFIMAVGNSGVPRAVYVSTTAALGPAPDGAAEGSEDADWHGPFPTAYHRTKNQAHHDARAAQRHGMPLIIVCPAMVYGPGDEGPGGRMIADFLAGRLPALVADPAWFSYVHVDDVVEGLVLSGDKGRTGTTYVLSGEHRALDAYVAEIARVAGKRPPPLTLPHGLARVSGSVLDVVSRLVHVRFPISRESIDAVVRDRWLHPHERATRELGWRPRSLAEGLPETVAWFAAQRRKA